MGQLEEVRGSWRGKGHHGSGSSREGSWEDDKAIMVTDQQQQQLDGPAPKPPPLIQLQQQLQRWCGHLLTKLSPDPRQQQQDVQHQPMLNPTHTTPTLIWMDSNSKILVTRMAPKRNSTTPEPPPQSQDAPGICDTNHLHPPTLPLLHLLGSFSPWSPQQPPSNPLTQLGAWPPLPLFLRPPSSLTSAPPSLLPLAVLTQSPTLPPPMLLAEPPSGLRGANGKAELGRATWTLLHTLAAQLPEQPSRQQQRDTRQLVELLTRIYPCGDCAKHFQEIVKRDPPVVSSGHEFQAWMCRVHNTVNRSLGKPTFNCNFVTSRWSPLDCGENGEVSAPSACAMSIGTKR